MNYLFYLGHPAHFHLFKNCIRILKEKNHNIHILIKKKDVLENLLAETGWQFTNILTEDRGNNNLAIGWALLKREFGILKAAYQSNPDLMIGTSAEIAHMGKLLKIPSIVVNEDDVTAVPMFAKIAYPFATHILAPDSCDVGKWSYKKVKYTGYHELAYLHPKYFQPSKVAVKELQKGGERYFILRFAKLTAHHDTGKKGITTTIASKIIQLLLPHGQVYITSERKLEPEFEKYRIHLPPKDMHDALYYTDMYIGDSQTMAAEAAVLGTPSLRFNDFVGKLSYLEELEHKYGLTYGIKTNESEKLFQKIKEWIHTPHLKEEWEIRKQKMLNETIDVTSFMVWLLENFPKSVSLNIV